MNQPTSTVPIRRIIFASAHYPRPNLKKHPVSQRTKEQIFESLSKPSWSVRAMIPSATTPSQETVSTTQVNHLLKLSALQMSEEKTEEMRKTLNSHIFFVNEVQKVDTTGVEPCVAIRDESDEHVANSTVTLESLRSHLESEVKVGTNGTVRRQKPINMVKESNWNNWDMGKGTETRKKGSYYFVRKDKSQATED